MDIIRFIIRRTFHSAFVLFGLSIVIFAISRVVPGDPARMALGYQAPEAVVERLRIRMHYHDPIFVQYFYWIRDASSGDFGESILTRRPVLDDVKQTYPATLELAIYGGLFMIFGAVTLGTISAHNKDSWIDNVVRVFAYLGVVTPPFVFGVIFVLVFGFWLGWLPTIGRSDPVLVLPPKVTGLLTIDSLLVGNMVLFVDAVKHLAGPSIAMAMGGMAQGARLTRSTMSDNMSKDYIAAARALGIHERTILWRFLLKPSLIPTVSILGLDIAAIIGNAFLLEVIYNWPGISRYAIRAMQAKDLNAISGTVLMLGLTFIVFNITVDVIVGILDPRTRLTAQRGE